MATIKLRNLGQLGINTDLAPESMSPLGMTGGQNVSFFNQMPQKAKGYVSGVFGTLTFAPYFVMPAQGPSDFTWVLAGLAKVNAFYNGGLVDITRVAGDYTGNVSIPWTGAWVNGVTFLNNGNDDPQFVSTIDGSAKLADLTNWQANTKCRVLRAFKNYLIAMDVTKAGTRYPTLFKWSHPADPGGVPPSWDETDASYLTGEFPISATPGRIVDGLMLKNSFIVYKSDGIVAVRETGDNDIFRFDPISTKFGVPAVNCITEFKPGMHAFISQTGDLMVNNGQGVQSIATNRVKKLISEDTNFAELGKAFVFTDVRNSEINFCFVTGAASWPNRAITWNWEENTFGIKDMPESSSVAEGKFNVVTAPSEAWDDDDTAWDDDTESWDGSTVNVISNRILSVSPETTEAYLLSDGFAADGADMVSGFERKSMALAGEAIDGSLTLDPSVVKLVTRVWPLLRAEDGETFLIRIGMQDRMDSPINWQGPFTFNPATQEYLEFFAEGRYVSYSITHTGSSRWECAGLDFELKLRGRYL